jgi:hypothetical protein
MLPSLHRLRPAVPVTVLSGFLSSCKKGLVPSLAAWISVVYHLSFEVVSINVGTTSVLNAGICEI